MATGGGHTTGRGKYADKDGKSSKHELLRAVGLVGLPLLAFQRNILNLVRTGLETARLHPPLQKLAQSELHALFIILDPDAKWRNSLGDNIEKKVQATLDQAVPKVISGAVSLIDAQTTVLDAIIKECDP